MVFYTLVLLILFKKWAKTKKKMIRKTEKKKKTIQTVFLVKLKLQRESSE